MESEQDIADAYEEWDEGNRPSMSLALQPTADTLLENATAPATALGSNARSGGSATGTRTGTGGPLSATKPVSIPASQGGVLHAPAFESGGRHILYCGTDLLVDNAHVLHDAGRGGSGNYSHSMFGRAAHNQHQLPGGHLGRSVDSAALHMHPHRKHPYEEEDTDPGSNPTRKKTTDDLQPMGPTGQHDAAYAMPPGNHSSLLSHDAKRACMRSLHGDGLPHAGGSSGSMGSMCLAPAPGSGVSASDGGGMSGVMVEGMEGIGEAGEEEVDMERTRRRAKHEADDRDVSTAEAGYAAGMREGMQNDDNDGNDDDDEVLEVEADTPGGYHVAAFLTHHRKDPNEYMVSARILPTSGGSGP